MKKETKELISEIGIAAAKGAVSLVPFGGGFLSEIISVITNQTAKKRYEKWVAALEERLGKLEASQKDNLEQNEFFQTCLIRATQDIIRTHQEEKIKLLANAVINSGFKNNLSEDEQLMFLNWVDKYTYTHLSILIFFANPSKRLQEKNLKNNYYMGSPLEVLFDMYPHLRANEKMVDIMIKELYDDGLLGSESLHVTMTGQGMTAKRTTEYGDKFIQFISENQTGGNK